MAGICTPYPSVSRSRHFLFVLVLSVDSAFIASCRRSCAVPLPSSNVAVAVLPVSVQVAVHPLMLCDSCIIFLPFSLSGTTYTNFDSYQACNLPRYLHFR